MPLALLLPVLTTLLLGPLILLQEKEYLLPNEEDYEILSLIKTLESKQLPDHDKEIVEIIKTQIKDEWRKPLLEKLKQLTQKYF